MKIYVNPQFSLFKICNFFCEKFVISQSLGTWTRRQLTILRSSRGDGIYLFQISLSIGLHKRNPKKLITNVFKGKQFL